MVFRESSEGLPGGLSKGFRAFGPGRPKPGKDQEDSDDVRRPPRSNDFEEFMVFGWFSDGFPTLAKVFPSLLMSFECLQRVFRVLPVVFRGSSEVFRGSS